MGRMHDGKSPVLGDIRQLTERKPLEELPAFDVDELVEGFERTVKAAVTEAFERVLHEFCTELVREAGRQPYEMARPQLQNVIRDTRKKIPEIVERALTKCAEEER